MNPPKKLSSTTMPVPLLSSPLIGLGGPFGCAVSIHP